MRGRRSAGDQINTAPEKACVSGLHDFTNGPPWLVAMVALRPCGARVYNPQQLRLAGTVAKYMGAPRPWGIAAAHRAASAANFCFLLSQFQFLFQCKAEVRSRPTFGAKSRFAEVQCQAGVRFLICLPRPLSYDSRHQSRHGKGKLTETHGRLGNTISAPSHRRKIPFALPITVHGSITA